MGSNPKVNVVIKHDSDNNLIARMLSNGMFVSIAIASEGNMKNRL